jgi:hypothetical protein
VAAGTIEYVPAGDEAVATVEAVKVKVSPGSAPVAEAVKTGLGDP